jgi:hypothetical protein
VANTGDAWARALTYLIERSHLVTGDQLSGVVDEAVRAVGLRAEVFLVDFGQRVLTSVRESRAAPLSVEGTLAGRAFQQAEFVSTVHDDGRRVLWMPMLDSTERTGVMRLVLDDDVADDPEFRERCWTLSGVMGHLVMTKMAYSDRLRRLRAPRPLSVASEILWQLVPPRTFATDRVVVSALLEPYDRVAGDAYDYAVDSGVAYVAIFDGVGHDIAAGSTTALAVNAIRNVRRRGVEDLDRLAEAADEQLGLHQARGRFVTAVLGRLDTTTGELSYLVAGHPPPLLLRGGHAVKTLSASTQPPLGVHRGSRTGGISTEWLEPGDRLLFYSDGITEARDSEGRFFGEGRLVDLTERAEAGQLSAPETLRRLAQAVLEHQSQHLQDDATMLLLDWSTNGHELMFPRAFPRVDPQNPSPAPA